MRPVCPESEKYAASPIPLAGVPDDAASRAAVSAVGPGCEIVTSIVSLLVWLSQRQAVPWSAIARAVTVPAAGENVASRPKFGLKSYMVCALTTELQGIDTGVGLSAVGVSLSDGDDDGEGEEAGGVDADGDVGGFPLSGGVTQPARPTATTSPSTAKVMGAAKVRVRIASFSFTDHLASRCNAASGVFDAG